MAGDSKGQPSWWVVVLLSVLGVYTFGAPGTGSTGSAGTGTKPAEKKSDQGEEKSKAEQDKAAAPLSACECLRPVYEFWGQKLPAYDYPLKDPFPNSGQGRYEFLIATVPDPVDSRLGFMFDQEVDAICAAVQASGDYQFDRYWLPWKLRAAKPQSEEAAARDRERFENHPGVLLFRDGTRDKNSPDPPCRLLVVFLVGETPTAGVHKGAFEKALNLVRRNGDSGGWREHRILGPTFSGSVDSLALVLRKFAARCARVKEFCPLCHRQAYLRGDFLAPRFRLISGSATAVDRMAFEQACRPARATFQATLFSDRFLTDRVLEYLRNRRGCEGRVAILTESNTAYGAGMASEFRNFEPQKDVSTEDAVSKDAPPSIVHLRFPLHIASLRPAYDAERAKRGQAVEKLDPYAPQVHIPFDGNDQTMDFVPSLDPAMSTVATDQVINQLVTSIRAEGVRAVGLFATDVRDKIFLATLIRQHFPSVTLFTTDADLLLASREHREALGGMILASTYSMAPRNQDWTFAFRGHKNRLHFSSQTGYGVYNAALALRNDDRYLLEYGPPLKNCRAPRFRLPSVWFSVIGTSGIWPLTAEPLRGGFGDGDYSTLLDKRRDKDKTPNDYFGYTYIRRVEPDLVDRSDLETGKTRLSYSALGYLFSTLVAVVCLAAVWAMPRYFQDDYAAVPDLLSLRAVKYRRVFWAALCFASLLAVNFYYLRLWLIPLRPPAELVAWHYGAALVLVLGFAINLVFTGAMATRCLMATDRARGRGAHYRVFSALAGQRGGIIEGFRRRCTLLFRACLRLCGFEARMRVVTTFLLSAAVVLYLAVMLHGNLSDRTLDQTLAFDRAMSFGSGLSPLVPVALLGAALFGWGRSQLLVTRQLGQFLFADPFDKGAAKRAAGSLTDAVLRPFHKSGRTYLIAWVAVAGLTTVVLARSMQPSYDHAWFSRVTWVAVWLLIVLTLSGLAHVMRVVNALLKLTGAISEYPLGAALDRLPDKVSVTYGRLFTGHRPGLAEFQFPAAQHDYAETVFSTPGSPPQLNLTQRLAEDMEHPERRPETPGLLSAECARAITALEAEYWRSLPINVRFPVADKEIAKTLATPPSSPHSAADWHSAEDFVATHLVMYLNQFLTYIRHQAFILAVAPVLLLLAISIYQFQPHSLLLLMVNALIVASVGVILTLIVRINLDEAYSRISRTEPFGLSMDKSFLTSALAYALPLVVLVLTQFDEVSNWLFSWLEGF